MSERPEDLDPASIKDLENPAFLKYAKARAGQPIKPDDEDFDKTVSAHTVAERAEQYRMAQARRLIRLYREWKAGYLALRLHRK
jgi:hypothetical protein